MAFKGEPEDATQIRLNQFCHVSDLRCLLIEGDETTQLNTTEECIPVGCVPSACWPYPIVFHGRRSTSGGGVYIRGRGLHLGEGSTSKGGVYIRGRGLLLGRVCIRGVSTKGVCIQCCLHGWGLGRPPKWAYPLVMWPAMHAGKLPPVDRQLPVKTLHCSKLRLRAVIKLWHH